MQLVSSQVIPAAVDPKYLVFVMLLVLSFKSGKLSVLDTRRPFSQKYDLLYKLYLWAVLGRDREFWGSTTSI